MSKNVHIVPHMHWDREWYFTTEESRILLVNNMEEIMERLETDENYPHYVLDGQTAILEDYFDIKPENKERVKKLVEQGKLIVGPWYTQTDEMVVGAESIVRNLLYGLKDSRELGEPMMIGYLPDSFGQSEKLPQILNGFDINRAIFWRGASERHGSTKNNFYWKSESEGEVLVHLMPLGYAIGKYLPVEEEALRKRMSKYMPVLERGAVNDAILVANGHDQMPIQKDIYEVMDTMKKIYPDKTFFLSKYENVFEEVEQVKDLDTLQGELLDGKYMRVHRSIFSSRADLKSSNTRIENKITNILEPLASLAHSFGEEYHEGLIEAIWKELMKNHAHDSIGCCCSDIVHTDIENRFHLAENKTDELIKFYKRRIVDAMSMDIALDKLTAFNLVSYARTTVVEGEIITKMKNFDLVDGDGKSYEFEVLSTEIVDAGLIDRQIVHYGDYDPFVRYTVAIYDTLPAMGFKTYIVVEKEGQLEAASQGTTTENEFYKIVVNKNGTLSITDKDTEKVYENVLLVEDGADDGDGYDFSELEDDFILTSKDVKAVSSVVSTENKTVIEIDYTMETSKDLDSRKAKMVDGSFDMNLVVSLTKGSKIIDVKVTVDNRVKDHRVRLLIPNGIGSKFSLSDNQFGEIKRPVYDSAMDVWEKEKWNERPDSIYPFLSYVSTDAKGSMAVLSNSVREYEIIGDDYDVIAITLFRCVGFLGKEELYRRPGRPSGIKMPTPDSQLLGVNCYELALTTDCSNLAKVAKEYTTPVVTYNKMPYNAMKLNAASYHTPYSYSFLTESSQDFVVTAFKKAQGKEGFILRGFQTVIETLETEIQVEDFKITSEVNLDERAISESSEVVKLPRNVAKTYLIK